MSRLTYKYCPVQRKVVPYDQALTIIPDTKLHHFQSDDIPPTKHPVTGQYYTSKTRFREATRAAGCVEVGDAYERGYEPDRESGMKQLTEKLREVFRRKLNE